MSSPTVPRGSDAELGVTWLRMMTLFFGARDQFLGSMHECGLTPPHGHALGTLRDGPLRMRDLAEHLDCDASYVTAIVDRLEELGLAERVAASTDRRVKEVALTERGADLAHRLHGLFVDAPPELSRLDARDRAALARIMEKIVPEPAIPTGPFRQRGG